MGIFDAVEEFADDFAGDEASEHLVTVEAVSYGFGRVFAVGVLAVGSDAHTRLVHTNTKRGDSGGNHHDLPVNFTGAVTVSTMGAAISSRVCPGSSIENWC